MASLTKPGPNAPKKKRKPAPRVRRPRAAAPVVPPGRGAFAVAAEQFQEGIARICHLYGVTPLVGRLFAILFLATEPRSLEDLTHAVGAAKSSVSVALRKLLSMRVVRRLPPRGDRRDFYEAVADPWVVFADWSRLFFQPEIEMWSVTSRALLGALGDASDTPAPADRDELRRRIAALQGFMDVIDTLMGSVARSRPATPPARTIPIAVEGAER
jgi:DNA-binding transcriptional regulator GbsR (MarR family)